MSADGLCNIAMPDLMLASVTDAFRPYLRQVLAQNPPEQHEHLKGQFAAHMAFLADFCLEHYPGRGGLTVDFIRSLHRACFPPNYRQAITTREGVQIWMVPGEYKTISNNVSQSHLHPGKINVFLASEKVAQAMQQVVACLNAALVEAIDDRQKQGAILWFVIDFLAIHPFIDANGRVACILTDLLAIREGLAPFLFYSIKDTEVAALTKAVELAREHRNLDPVYAILAAHGRFGASANSIVGSAA